MNRGEKNLHLFLSKSEELPEHYVYLFNAIISAIKNEDEEFIRKIRCGFNQEVTAYNNWRKNKRLGKHDKN